MLAHVRNIHAGKSFAVLGSGPSVSLFQRKEDVVIGVNGAGQLLRSGDYLFSQDERACMRSWFTTLAPEVTCVLKATAAMRSERLYPDREIREGLIGIFESYVKSHPSEVRLNDDGFKTIRPGNPVIDAFQELFPIPKPPHMIVRFVNEQSISREMGSLIKKGTSACGAMQLAYVMGASEIHLYGVQFTNDAKGIPTSYSGTNYFYVPKPGEEGRTMEEQRIDMDGIASRISCLGAKVYSHGFTRLKNTIKMDADKCAPLAEQPAPSRV
ncbi:MAG: hypothetical protein WC588_01675 [Candidatus Micrarchaeia archaeon]